jgi:hypothetical protein
MGGKIPAGADSGACFVPSGALSARTTQVDLPNGIACERTCGK